jgi:2-polyprenyl-6-methoxyphenol hydroxylase-like FAD-dependent oxidoreductase
MTLPANKILVVGGGFTGMSVAMSLTKIGAEVDLVEIDENWRAEGAGITVSGPSLRALEALGLYDIIQEQGAFNYGLEAFSAEGHLIMKIPALPVPMSSVEGGGGIMRPVLAKAMAERTRDAGVNVKLGHSYSTLEDQGDSVDVSFSDGETGQYDLVIGADGLFSSVRKNKFPDAPTPQYTGQGVWRAVLPRFEIETATQFLGRKGKVGFTPVSDDEMYLYYTDKRPEKERVDEKDFYTILSGFLEEFNAPLMLKIKEALNENCLLNYRPLEGMLMPRDWFNNRILLMGDAVHATTPHLASGAGMGFEDAVVLAAEFEKGGELQEVLSRYQNRRWERCRMIVQNSLRLGQIEFAGGPFEEHGQIMALSMSGLLAPI